MLLASTLVLIAALASPAWAERRALILSNADYTELPDLQNTHADADAYAEVFDGFGYEVTRLRDLGLDPTLDELDRFLAQLRPGDEVVFVYSGHGWSDGQRNFLIPVDAPLRGSDRQRRRDTLALKDGRDGILDGFERTGVKLAVAIVDACRNNPFEPRVGTRSAGLSRGLAPLEPSGGSFVIYSAGIGQEALDRLPDDPPDQRLSVFTRSFVPYLRQGLYLEDAIGRAQLDTADLAARAGGHLQHPAYYDAALGPTCVAETCLDGASADAATLQAELERLRSEREMEQKKLAEQLAALQAERDRAKVGQTPKLEPYPKAQAGNVPVDSSPSEPDADIASINEPKDAVPTDALSAEYTRQVQEWLAEADCNPGPADGVWGPKSQLALRSYEVASGLGELALDATLLEKLSRSPITKCTNACADSEELVQGRCLTSEQVTQTRDTAPPAKSAVPKTCFVFNGVTRCN